MLRAFAISMARCTACGIGSSGLPRIKYDDTTKAEALSNTSSGMLSGRSLFMCPSLIANVRSPSSEIRV
ncbi:Uncharacterised protein [Vibrio cholerae]|nr:Uncharacterised protein [Vibrio cholerae]CSB76205.1 Uncharacterised protein [Vibrio cholerae]CSC73552.1 Uncharacterised protein [Vibrio cholerae]